ncbi:MAG: glycoside hydrolase family 13 protein [Gaiellaceae bacterium]
MTNAARGPDWVPDAVFYEIFPDRFHNGDRSLDPSGVAPWGSTPTRENFFGGDLLGVKEKLPHLQRLGVTGLYLTPIFRAGSNHRYDTHDYREVDPMLGDAGALRELVTDAHGRGIKVVLDGVFNHVGDGFWAFRDLQVRGEKSPYREWFDAPHLPLTSDPPNYQTCGGAPFLPKLDTSNGHVRDHLLDVATHWVEEAGIDGWRLDVPWKVPLEFWQAFRARLTELRPELYLVGEAWWSWGELLRVFDGLMNYRLRSALLGFCLFDTMDAEDFAIELQLLLADAGGGGFMLNLLGSHDTPRLFSLAGGDEAKVGFALGALFALPGVPMIYYGDEIGMDGGEDPDCRRAMQWDEAAWRRSIFDRVTSLIALRAASPALRRGTTEVLLTFNRVLALRRRTGDDDMIVLLNAGPPRSDFPVRLPLDASSTFVDALDGDRYSARDSCLVVPHLPGRAALFLRAHADDD